MKKSVVVELAEIITPLGSREGTVHGLYSGSTAVVSASTFDVPVSHAPFKDIRFRSLIFCAKQLIEQIPAHTFDAASSLLIYCSAKGDIHNWEKQTPQTHIPASDISPLLDKQAEIICLLLGLRSTQKLVISNACASGSIGIEIAFDFLQQERFSHVILFGFDCLSHFTTTGFYSIGALSKTGAHPFDFSRDGLSMGEGCGIAVLTLKKEKIKDTVILGAGSSNDANHRTGPAKTGEGLYRAAKTALDNAGSSKSDIGCIKCHGTATKFNDAMEAKALYALFGESCPPCVSFKGAMGHLSGAGSLIEIIIIAEMLKRLSLAPTAGFQKLGVDEPIPIASHIQSIDKPTALCLSAGFGGLNSAIVTKVVA